MIKRQFYALEHRNRDDSSSSSADAAASEDTQENEDVLSPIVRHTTLEGSIDEELTSDTEHVTSDGGQWQISEGITEHENERDKREAGKFIKQKEKGKLLKVETEHSNQWADAVEDADDERLEALFDECVLKCKGVFKCRFCPKVICLSENTMQAHLTSKRHARSIKQFAEGRLKVMLNSDGEEEEEGETHAERHARIVASAQEPTVKRKKNSGRQRQHKRAKRKNHTSSASEVDKKPLITNSMCISETRSKKAKQVAVTKSQMLHKKRGKESN